MKKALLLITLVQVYNTVYVQDMQNGIPVEYGYGYNHGSQQPPETSQHTRQPTHYTMQV